MNEDLFIIHFIIINSILSMTVVNDNPNERYPNSIDCNEGRSIALFILNIHNDFTYLEL